MSKKQIFRNAVMGALWLLESSICCLFFFFFLSTPTFCFSVQLCSYLSLSASLLLKPLTPLLSCLFIFCLSWKTMIGSVYLSIFCASPCWFLSDAKEKSQIHTDKGYQFRIFSPQNFPIVLCLSALSFFHSTKWLL